jgi:hypothetical protein
MAPLLDYEARERIWRAADQFLYSAVERIETARSLPLPGRESPWMDENRIWNILGRDLGSPLTEAIEKEMPERGKIGSRYPWPNLYPMALLRGVIAAATVAWERPAAHGEIARTCIADMLDQLADSARTLRTIRLLTEVDATRVAGSTIHHVRLEPVRALESTISHEMKEAAAEALRLPTVMPGSREPRVLAVVDARGERDEWELAKESRSHFWHALTALRLTTAATIVQAVEIEGQPSMVHIGAPLVRALDGEPGYWRRVAVLTPDDIPGLEAMAQTMCDLDARPPNDIPSIVLAINRFNRSLRPAIWQDEVVDLAIGLEAALSSGEREDLTLALRTRAAHLLAIPGDPATEIFADVGDLMQLRGKVVHGAIVSEKDWDSLFKRRGITQVLVEDRLTIAVDRWRDLLRRAILARLMLGETGATGPAPWPLMREISVDGILVGPAGRRHWRTTIRSRARRLAWDPRGGELSRFGTPCISRTATAWITE